MNDLKNNCIISKFLLARLLDKVVGDGGSFGYTAVVQRALQENLDGWMIIPIAHYEALLKQASTLPIGKDFPNNSLELPTEESE